LAELQRGIDRAQANDCAGAVSALKGAVDAPAFGQLTPRQQYIAERILAGSAFDTRDHPMAVRMSRLTTASTFAEQSDWYVRFLSSYVSEDKVDASLTMEKIAATWPDVLHDRVWGLGGMGTLVYNRDASNQFRFITSLRRDDYQIPNDQDAAAAGRGGAQCGGAVALSPARAARSRAFAYATRASSSRPRRERAMPRP